RKVYAQIQNKLQKDSETSVMVRYEIGEMIDRVKGDDRKYGEAAIPQLAQALARKENELWAYHRLATAWTKLQIQKILAKKNVKGSPITYTHLLALAGIDNKKKRDDL